MGYRVIVEYARTVPLVNSPSNGVRISTEDGTIVVSSMLGNYSALANYKTAKRGIIAMLNTEDIIEVKKGP